MGAIQRRVQQAQQRAAETQRQQKMRHAYERVFAAIDAWINPTVDPNEERIAGGWPVLK